MVTNLHVLSVAIHELSNREGGREGGREVGREGGREVGREG